MRRKVVAGVGIPILAFIIYLIIPLKQRIPADYSQVVLAKDSTFLRVFLNSDEQWCLPPQLQTEIPENLKLSVLNYEDQYFEYHPGFNPVAILRALYWNITRGEVVSGGSTITMQVARMIRDQDRTIFQKFLEIALAI